MWSTFKYRPLQRVPIEIRVLELQPAAELASPLVCTLQHATLDEAAFFALSYEWGPAGEGETDIQIIHPEGSSVLANWTRYYKRIRRNLAAALRCLRSKYGRVAIWTDALCINQDDLDEKSWQVGLMTDIYSHAVQVHAWLGPYHGVDAATSSMVEEAFDVMQAIWKDAISGFRRHVDTIVVGIRRSRASATTTANLSAARLEAARKFDLETEKMWLKTCETIMQTQEELSRSRSEDSLQAIAIEIARAARQLLVSDAQTHKFLLAMQRISSISYFRRVWILQEIGRARNLTFHYRAGQAADNQLFFSLSLARGFRDAAVGPSLRQIAREVDTSFTGCTAARLTCTQRRSLNNVLELSYLDRSPVRGATDKRDLIYALLGLADSAGHDGVTVDYNLDLEIVFAMATRSLLRQGFSDSLISFIPWAYDTKISPVRFPSWAYDWSTKCSTSFMAYKACGNTVLRMQEDGDRKIAFRGVEVGCIRSLGVLFSSSASEVGFDERVVRTGDLASSSLALSQSEKQRVRSRISELYASVGIDNVDADVEILFATGASPLPLFYCWLLEWILGLWDLLVQTTHVSQTSGGTQRLLGRLARQATPTSEKARVANVKQNKHSLSPILELLLRQAPSTSSKIEALKERLKSSRSLVELINLRLLLGMLLQPITEPSGKSYRTDMELVDVLFHSAWGLQQVIVGDTRLAYVPEYSEPSDVVAVLSGVKAPLVLRRAQDGKSYDIIGPAYVCGMMEGQAMSRGQQRTYVLT